MKFNSKKHLDVLERHRVGTYRRSEKKALFLDRNERVTPYDKNVMSRLLSYVAKVQLNLYPDVDIFYDKLAGWLKLRQSQLFVTEGVSGAVKSVIETISRPGDIVVFPTPTFAMYPVYCRMFDLKYRTFGYNIDYSYDLNSLKKCIDNKVRLVFLPNPNVPIEGTLDLDKIASLASYCRRNGAFLVMDEVYYPFGGPTAIGMIRRYDNLLVMRSFSKAFGLAGIRVGFIAGNEDIINYISKVRTGYEIDSVSMEIASFFMDNYGLVKDHIFKVKAGLEYLKHELDGLGIDHNGGDTSNFIFINVNYKKTSEKIVKSLKDKRIHVRGGWPKPFDGGFSVTAGPKPTMKILVTELKRILNDRS